MPDYITTEEAAEILGYAENAQRFHPHRLDHHR
jgi:hypothetical protein